MGEWRSRLPSPSRSTVIVEVRCNPRNRTGAVSSQTPSANGLKDPLKLPGPLASLAYDFENVVLDAPHDRVRPEAGVEIERRRKPVAARKVDPGDAVSTILEEISAFEDVEKLSSDGDVFIEGRGRDLVGLRPDRESDSLTFFPIDDGLDEEHTSFERRVPDGADAAADQAGLDGFGKPDPVKESVRAFAGRDGPYLS